MIADGSYQHLIQRGNNKNKVFHRHDEHLIYLGLIARYLPEFALELHHYCLMPNHVHMLVRAVRGRDVSAFMKLVTQTYTNRYKLRRGYFGALWQGRFQNVEIASDDQLLRCARYIERNPLAAGLVKKTG